MTRARGSEVGEDLRSGEGHFLECLGADKRVASELEFCVLRDSFYNLLHDESADTRARKKNSVVVGFAAAVLCCVVLCVCVCLE